MGRGWQTEFMVRARSGLLVLCGCLLWVGCASSVALERSKYLPSATATAKVSTTSTGGTRIYLEFTKLAQPSRVIANAASYVVWVSPLVVDDEPEPTSMGAVALDEELTASVT